MEIDTRYRRIQYIRNHSTLECSRHRYRKVCVKFPYQITWILNLLLAAVSQLKVESELNTYGEETPPSFRILSIKLPFPRHRRKYLWKFEISFIQNRRWIEMEAGWKVGVKLEVRNLKIFMVPLVFWKELKEFRLLRWRWWGIKLKTGARFSPVSVEIPWNSDLSCGTAFALVCGNQSKLSHFISRIMRIIFPDEWERGNGIEEHWRASIERLHGILQSLCRLRARKKKKRRRVGWEDSPDD